MWFDISYLPCRDLDYLVPMPKKTQGKTCIAVVQMAMRPQPAENLKAAAAWVAQAARRGAKIICLPELFRTHYFCQREDPAFFDLAEPIPGPTTRYFARIARKHKVALIVPVFERRAPGLFHNSAVTLDANGAFVGHYRKMHIPDDPGYYEKYYFTPGDLGFQACTTRHGRIGTLLCWDQWFPEAARATALQGAQVLFYPTAIGWHPREKKALRAVQREAWQIIQRAHAVANGTYVAVANRVGHERLAGSSGGLDFWGASFICDPLGTLLVEARIDREDVLLAEVDPRRIEAVRCNWPFLRDRRIDAYEAVLQRYLDPA